MKALSVRSPWAELVIGLADVPGPKAVENRSWRTRYRGPLLICSSARPDRVDLEEIIARASADQRAAVATILASERLLGVALGFVDLVDVVDRHGSPWAIEGQRHWLLANPRPLARPFPVKGDLGIFEVELPAEQNA